jgi:hypothetical protein
MAASSLTDTLRFFYTFLSIVIALVNNWPQVLENAGATEFTHWWLHSARAYVRNKDDFLHWSHLMSTKKS